MRIKMPLMENRKRLLHLLLMLFLSCNLFSQITVDIKEMPIKEALKEIENKSSFKFFYNNDLKGLDKVVTLKTVNNSIDATLKLLFEGSDINYQKQENNIILLVEKKVNKNQEDKKIITGIVKDVAGEPMIGVTISEKGAQNGTITGADGTFSIRTSPNAILLISYIGYEKTEIKATTGKIVIVLREDTKVLDEVVVVGYGTQKKINLTGAVTQISAKEIEDRPVANLSQVLQGAIPNLNVTFSSGRPGSTGSFNVRGNTSINGGNPLVLIDGFEGNIDRINPDDVETISVLKDASASAIYGARASFGVILITTKKGKEGKAEITYTGRYSFSKPTTSTDYETRGYYSAKINDDFFRSYAGKNYTKYTEDDYYQLWIRRNDKKEHPDRPWVVTDQRDGRDTYVYYANTDLYDYLYDDSRPTWEHNVSISGGSDIVKYKFSANYFDQDGIVRLNTDNFRKHTFNASVVVQARPWLQISNSTRYYRSKYTFPGYKTINDLIDNAMYSALASFVPVNPDGTAVYQTSLMDYRYAEGRSALLVNGYHTNADIWDDFTTSFEAKVDIMKGLSLVANYNYSKVNYSNDKRTDTLKSSKYPGEIMERKDDIGLSQLYKFTSDRFYHATNIYASYSKDFYKNHHFNAVVGYNYETLKIADLTASREGLLTTELNDFNLAKGDVMTITGGQNSYAIMGGFMRLNYNYAGKYLLEASGRYDGTSRFRRGDRFGFFPSASLGWRISEEKFFAPIKKVIEDFKIRYSYGSLGNQQVVGYYDYMQTIDPSKTMNYSLGDGAKLQYATVSDPNSQNLTWEKVYTNNIGVDLLFLNQRLSFTGDIYQRDTKGMLTKGKTLPAVYGASSPKENAANLRTKGWEIILSWKDKFNVANKPLSYSISLGLSDYTSKITKYDNPTKLLSDYYVGQKFGDIWGYHIGGYFLTDEEAANYVVDQSAVNAIINASAGSEKGLKAGDLKYLDLDGNDVISIGKNTADDPGDRTIIGNSQPRYSYGINVSAAWNGIDISAFFQGIGRQHWYPAPHSMAFWGPYSRPFASFIPSGFMDDVWSEENPNAYFPRPRGYTAMATNRQLGAVNDRYLQNLAYCRLKNLTIGYTLPDFITRKAKLNKLRIFFSGENLFTLTKLESDYIDPEQASGSNGTGKVYPWSKTYSFGLNVTF